MSHFEWYVSLRDGMSTWLQFVFIPKTLICGARICNSVGHMILIFMFEILGLQLQNLCRMRGCVHFLNTQHVPVANC